MLSVWIGFPEDSFTPVMEGEGEGRPYIHFINSVSSSFFSFWDSDLDGQQIHTLKRKRVLKVCTQKAFLNHNVKKKAETGRRIKS